MFWKGEQYEESFVAEEGGEGGCRFGQPSRKCVHYLTNF